MANELAETTQPAHAVKLGGIDLAEELGLIVHMDTEDQLLPSVQEYSLNIPGRHGAYTFDSYFQPREFTLDIIVPSQDSFADVQRKMRKFTELLLDQYGNPKVVTLTLPQDFDKHYNVKLTGAIDPTRIAKSGSFSVNLTAYDPYAYSNIWNDGVTWGSEEITFTYDYLLGDDSDAANEVSITRPQTLSLYNYGYAVKPEITIEGSASSITVSANGKSFTLPSFSNAKYVINGELFTVTKNGANAFNDLTGEFIEMLTGANEVNVSGSGLNVKMSVKYRFKYL